MVKKLLFGLCCLFCADLYAADDLCNQYKKIPYVNVLRENGGVKIQSSNDIMPIYVENVDNVPIAFETIQNKIVDDVRLKNLVEKFKKQQENDASILDGTEDEKIKKCIENKVNDAFERYFKSKKK